MDGNGRYHNADDSEFELSDDGTMTQPANSILSHLYRRPRGPGPSYIAPGSPVLPAGFDFDSLLRFPTEIEDLELLKPESALEFETPWVLPAVPMTFTDNPATPNMSRLTERAQQLVKEEMERRFPLPPMPAVRRVRRRKETVEVKPKRKYVWRTPLKNQKRRYKAKTIKGEDSALGGELNNDNTKQELSDAEGTEMKMKLAVHGKHLLEEEDEDYEDYRSAKKTKRAEGDKSGLIKVPVPVDSESEDEDETDEDDEDDEDDDEDNYEG